MNPHLINIKTKIAKGELEKAVEQLQEIAINTPLLNDVILHSSRLSNLSKQIHKGIIRHEDANITQNQITDAVLALIDEIGYEIGKNEKIKEEVDQFLLSYQKLKEGEDQMTVAEKKARFQHFDYYDSVINSKLPTEKFRLQKLNSEQYLQHFGLKVQDLKEKLQQLDYFNGEINNEFTKELANSLEIFQMDNNMRHIDGFFGELTYDMIALRLKELT